MNHRKEVMEEVERLGIGTAIEAAENLVAKVRREVGKSGYGLRPVAGEATSLSHEVITALAEGLVPFLREMLAEATAPLIARIDAIEATQLTDGGTWKPEKVFRPNMLTSYRGAIWICLQANSNTRPPNDCWRLMHKTIGGGRDEH